MPALTVVDNGVMYRNPDPGHRHISALFPHPLELPKGELICAYNRGSALYAADLTFYLARSADGGSTWPGHSLIHDHAQDDRPYSYHDPFLSRMRDGTLLIGGDREATVLAKSKVQPVSGVFGEVASVTEFRGTEYWMSHDGVDRLAVWTRDGAKLKKLWETRYHQVGYRHLDGLPHARMTATAELLVVTNKDRIHLYDGKKWSQLALQANDEVSVRRALDTIAQIARKAAAGSAPRHRVEGIPLIDEDDIPRIARPSEADLPGHLVGEPVVKKANQNIIRPPTTGKKPADFQLSYALDLLHGKVAANPSPQSAQAN